MPTEAYRLQRDVFIQAGYPPQHVVWSLFPEGANEVVVQGTRSMDTGHEVIYLTNSRGFRGAILSHQAEKVDSWRGPRK